MKNNTYTVKCSRKECGIVTDVAFKECENWHNKGCKDCILYKKRK